MSENSIQQVVYPQNEKIPNSLIFNFLFPDLAVIPRRFIFMLTSADSIPTYGYVLHKGDHEQEIFCIISNFYDPEQFFHMLDVYNDSLSPKLGYEMLLRNLKPIMKKDHAIQEQSQIISLIKCLTNVLSPFQIGLLICHLAIMHPIVIMSCQLDLASQFCFSILSLIYPLAWPGAFIPLLPEKMLDSIYAPFPFIIGVHAGYYALINQEMMEKHAIIILDGQIIEIQSDVQFPKPIIKLVSSFESDFQKSRPEERQMICIKLFLSVIGEALSVNPNSHEKLFKKWNILKLKEFDCKPFQSLILNSQIVQRLMSCIEEGKDNEVVRYYWFNQKEFSTNTQVQINHNPQVVPENYDPYAQILNLASVFSQKNHSKLNLKDDSSSSRTDPKFKLDNPK